jgi:DNA-binding NarL/FixJ family response regulator
MGPLCQTQLPQKAHSQHSSNQVEIAMNALPLRRSCILVMHQDPLLCAGLVAALRQYAQFDVHFDGVDRVVDTPTSIDVVIVDYPSAMRLADPGERAACGLAQARVLVLTANDREADIRRAVEAGIHGYLLVGGPVSELVEGVTAVAGGVRYLGRAAAQRMADSLTHTALTSREMDVLQFVVIGESNKAIARRLSIEVGTVKAHMRAIMAKLGAASRTQAAGIAAARGLVDERSPAERLIPHLLATLPPRTPPMWSLRAGRGEARV